MALLYTLPVLFYLVCCTQAALSAECDFERSRVARYVIKQARVALCAFTKSLPMCAHS